MLRCIFSHTYNGPLWFLQYLIGFMALTPIIFFLLENKLSRKSPKIYSICILVIIALASIFIKNNFLKYAMPFIFGAYAGRYLKSYIQKKYSSIFRIIAAIALLLSIFIGTALEFGHLYMVVRVLQVISIWVIADCLAVKNGPNDWMQISFFVYCLHDLILEPLEKVFLIILGNNILGAWADFFISPVITLCIIVGCAWICKKIPCLWRVLAGGR